MKINKIALVLSAMGLASAQLVLWEAGFGSQVATEGYWYAYDDEDVGSTSKWSCDGDQGSQGDDIAKDVDCFTGPAGALDIDFAVTDGFKGEGFTYGFAAVAFNLGPADEDNNKELVDISMYSGVTIDYNSTCKMNFQVSFGDALVEDNSHSKVLKSGANTTSLVWSDFRQASGWGTALDLADYLDKMEAFKFQAHTDNFSAAEDEVTDCNFVVNSIVLDGDTPDPVFGGAQGINLEYNLVGENLVFNGLSEALNVEVFDLQGKMVANGEVSSSANSISLEGLKNASYVVRTTAGQFLISIAD